MMENLWPLAVGLVGVLVAIAQLFVKQGDVSIREQAVKVEEKELALHLAKMNTEKLGEVNAQILTLTTQFGALTQEYTKVIRDFTATKADLDRTTAELEVSKRRVTELEAEVAQLKSENAAMRTELEALRGRVTVTEAKA